MTTSKRAICFALLALMAAIAGTGAHATQVGPVTGTGPWPAYAESVDGLPDHTVFRPQRWPAEKVPVFLWGNGGCSANGLAHAAYLRQVASSGYMVIALGSPGQARPSAPGGDATHVRQHLDALEWITRENARAGGEFAGHVDLTRIAVGGHSCGGLQALALSGDPRIDTTLVLNSGIYISREGARSGVVIDKGDLAKLHAPVLYLSGGPSDIAHRNALDDAAKLDHVPVFLGALPVGHGGTFSEPEGGEWARVTVRWLDWQLKANADASWDFAGPQCRLCKDRRWSVIQKQLPLPDGPFRQSLYVPVRDGTLLAMNVYRPARDGVPVAGPLPVLFSFTPYRARYRDANGRVAELALPGREAAPGLLEAGYVLAVADVRGKGASFGARRGFQDRTEAEDGHDLVQWLASQPWSAGKVGMVGCSYLGGTTVQVATTAPPALRAIFTGATDLDKFSFVRNGGIPAQFNTRPDEPLSDDLMSLPMDADRDGSLLRSAVAMHAGNTPMAPLWYGMPFRDSVSPLTGTPFWHEVGPYTYLDALKRSGIAMYFWSNLEDEPTGQMILAAENLNARLLIGPGSHCAAPPGLDLTAEIRKHFDQALKGAPAPAADSRVTWWLDGGGEGEGGWQRGARWPGASAERQTFYLAGGRGGEGVLQTARASSARPRFAVDYNVGGGEYFAFWVNSQHGKGLSFSTPALTAAQRLIGFPVVRLRLASDRPEPLLFAYLEQVTPDGAGRVLSFGRLAAAYRKTGTAPYNTLGLPWPTGLQADFAPLVPWREATLEFSMTPVSRLIPSGSRLRLVVSGADPRQRNLAEIRLDPPPNIELRLGGATGSLVELPLQPVESSGQ
jgi:putative CocE/NonD family hydrolase